MRDGERRMKDKEWSTEDEELWTVEGVLRLMD